MNPSCLEFFLQWQRELEHRSEMFSVRNIPSQQCWLNAAGRRFWHIKNPLSDWADAIRWLHHDDAVRLEDAHSRVLKLGGAANLTIRARLQAHKFVNVRNRIVAEHCSAACARSCAVVITLVSLV